MTLHELRSKVWYRLVKVFFILLFLVGYTVLVALIIHNHSQKKTSAAKTTIDCKLGVSKTITAQEGGLTDESNLQDMPTLQRACKINESDVTKAANLLEANDLAKGDSPFAAHFDKAFFTGLELHAVYYVNHHWGVVALESLSALVLMVIFFEFFRRIFYYIMLGTFRSSKSHHI